MAKSASEKKVRRSLRTEFNVLFLLVMVGMIGFCLIINVAFLEKVYLSHQTRVVKTAYKNINDASTDGSFMTDEYDIELQSICDTYGIELIVLDADSQMIKSSSSDADYMAHILWDNLVGTEIQSAVVTDRVILEKTEDYTMQIEVDKRMNTEYLEIWGVIDSGYIVMVRSALAGIRESVGIFNRFMMVVGLAAIVVGTIFLIFLTNRITRPILQLSDISSEMKDLNFEAKYRSNKKNKNELDILGDNINELSETLESTIQELKTANNELKQDIAHKEEIDEMRREFLSNVSHELKTPIALIQGYAEGLDEGVIDDPESMKFYCDVIKDEASKMDVLVKKLLTLNQLEFGNDVVKMERFDIVATINNYVKSSEILTKQKNAEVRIPDIDPVYVWADEFKTEEVIMNYFSNALNHLDGDNIIEIKIEKVDDADKVRISVFNTGEPIPAESIDHIWEKFYKVDKARTRAYGGSGVGLSIVKAIMESMHQAYGVKNYDNGVEFWFELETR